MGFIRIIIILAIVLAVGISVSAESTDVKDSEAVAEQQFEDFNLQGYTDSGEKAWDVTGETADMLGSDIKLTNIDANMYSEDTTNLVAKSGMIDKVSGEIHLERDVVITTQSGAKLTTDSLDWKRNEDLVATEDFVTIMNKQMTATGYGIEAHPSLKLAQLNKDVTVNIEPEKDNKEMGGTVTITCDGALEIDQIKNKATFNDNVVAIQVGRELKADKMEVFFDPETKKIKQVICSGHVIVTQGENRSYSDEATYSADTQKLILSGRPKLIMITGNNEGLPAFDKVSTSSSSENKEE